MIIIAMGTNLAINFRPVTLQTTLKQIAFQKDKKCGSPVSEFYLQICGQLYIQINVIVFNAVYVIPFFFSSSTADLRANIKVNCRFLPFCR